MELRHVRYFLAVAEERNFTRAAEKVRIGQPPLSQQIRSLEHELGGPLFRRLPHGAELTEAGAAFLPEARALIAQAERARKAAILGAQGRLGRLRIGFTGSAAFCALVPSTLRDFRRTHPRVELSLTEANTTELLAALTHGHLDAAFIRLGRFDPAGVQTHPLLDETMVALLPSGHRLAKGREVTLESLTKEPLVLFPRAAGPGLFDEIMAAIREVGAEANLGQEAPQITSTPNLVAAGLGVSIVPSSIAQIRVKGVLYRPIKGSEIRARLALVTRSDESSVVVRSLINQLAKR